MAKRVTISIPVIASGIGVAQGAGFDTQNVIAKGFGVIKKTNSPQDVIDEVMSEGEDVVMNLTGDPFGTGLNMALGAAVPLVGFKILGMGLDAVGVPKGKKFGKAYIKWAL